MAAALILSACGSGERNDGNDIGDGGTAGAAEVSPECVDAELESTEIGVTDKAIVVQVSADTGAPAAPGLASGSVDAVEAWAAEVNANGGLACRQVEVKTYDSKMDPTESRNAMVSSCESAFASVGDTMLAAADSRPLAECKDQAGSETGQPQLQTLGLFANQYCNDTTYFLFGPSGDPCPAKEGKRELTGATAISDYLQAEAGGETHGMFGVSADNVSTLATSVAVFEVMANGGMKIDRMIGAKSTDTSAEYTPRATALKDDESQFVMWGAPFPGFIQLRQEAVAQGVKSVEHWLCTACYDPAFVDAAGEVGPGTVVPLSHLPFEEAEGNEELGTFTEKVKTHNLFAALAWSDGRLFEEAVNRVVEADGVNGLTRAALLEQLDGITDFTNDGMIAKTTPSAKEATVCNVFVELTDDGKWERAFPEAEGEFHCGDLGRVVIDPATAFKG
ncbi:ABC transporter substrate-binding protein [Nocardioides sp. W7]|uniref:ABC transporter substrate-binding protein n=1 Tax=Nocardioides sp. W7 TaxID=2931390 RepID=UPI001FD2D46C|nr:ABC transporter substrate-binding protein [Nocardioides sp. W7]